MTTATATPSPLTPAELAAFYDAQAAAEDARRQAEEAAELAARQQIADDLDAAIMAAVDSAGIDGQYLTIHDTGNFYRRNGRISMPGFAPLELRAEYNGGGDKIAVFAWFNGSSYGKAKQAAIFNAMAAARRKWLEMDRLNTLETKREHEAAGQRMAEQAQRQQHDADALAAWAPIYRQYCTDLAAAYHANAAILRPIAEKHAGRKFRAARLTYGITADEADPTTETIWIADGDDPDGYFREIDGHGRIEVTRIWHPVKCSEWHIYTASDTFYSGGNYPPPVRRVMIRTGTGNWEIIAPPSAGDLRAEIEQEIAGRLAAAPARPDLPALWRPINGEELAWQIEREIVADEDERAALAGYMAGDFPSADPIPF